MLRVENPHLTDDFQRLANAIQSPLPWTSDDQEPGVLRDANGDLLLAACGSPAEAKVICALIMLAVNTCGGFKAEVA
jgi:hypothetical protein